MTAVKDDDRLSQKCLINIFGFRWISVLMKNYSMGIKFPSAFVFKVVLYILPTSHQMDASLKFSKLFAVVAKTTD